MATDVRYAHITNIIPPFWKEQEFGALKFIDELEYNWMGISFYDMYEKVMVLIKKGKHQSRELDTLTTSATISHCKAIELPPSMEYHFSFALMLTSDRENREPRYL